MPMIVILWIVAVYVIIFFFQAEDGIRYYKVTGVQTCALPILRHSRISFDEIIAAAKRVGLFMTAGYPEAPRGAGVFFEQNRQNKGLNRPALQDRKSVV